MGYEDNHMRKIIASVAALGFLAATSLPALAVQPTNGVANTHTLSAAKHKKKSSKKSDKKMEKKTDKKSSLISNDMSAKKKKKSSKKSDKKMEKKTDKKSELLLLIGFERVRRAHATAGRNVRPFSFAVR
jgi:hypothetical protein